MFANCVCHVCGNTIPLDQPVYTYDDNDGNENVYHMLCYKEQTRQGVQGFAPTKIYPPLVSKGELNANALSNLR